MADLRLEFGVLGGATLDGESGKAILHDLQLICSKISNGNMLKVAVHLDEKVKTSLREELEGINLNNLKLNTEKIKLKFDVDTKHLDNILKQYYSNYKSPVANATAPKQVLGSAKREFKEIISLQNKLKTVMPGSAMESALNEELKLHQNKYKLLVDQIHAMTDQKQKQLLLNELSLEGLAIVKQFETSSAKVAEKQGADAYKKALAEQKKIQELEYQRAQVKNNPALKDAYTDEINHHKQLLNGYKTEIAWMGKKGNSQKLLNDLKEKEAELALSYKTKGAKKSAEEQDALKLVGIYKEAAIYMQQFGDAIKRNNPRLYKELTDLLNELNSGSYAGGYNAAAQKLKEIQAEGAKTNATVETLGQKLKRVFGDKYIYGVLAGIAMMARRVTQQVLTNVMEIDSAMTQLSIVTGKTGDALDSAFIRAAESAKSLGANVADLLGSMETFARLGYNMEDSQILANVATMMGNVASVSVDEATTGMTSIIKGFELEVDQAEYVGDVLSNIGKKYAVSAAELIEAFQRSGAAFNATGTSFEKATALIAAGNAAVQDSSVVGTALKAVSARIRGATSELQEMGEEYEDVATGMSKYRDELMALTNVDGTGGFDIMENVETGDYKDLYDIFVGISGAWDEMSETSQARVSEILGGTRQLQVISSIMGNITDAVGAYNDALESTGSLTKDNAIYLDSIQGRLNTLKATFQEFSNEVLNSDLVKDGITLLTTLLEKLTQLNDTVNVLNFAGILGGLGKFVEGLDRAGITLSSFIANIKTGGGLGIPGWIGLIVAGLSAINGLCELITGKDLLGWFMEWTMPAEEKLKRVEASIADVNEQMKATAESARSLKTSYDDVVPRFLELYEKAGDINFLENTKLSDEEYVEFFELQNKIAEMFPELDLGVDSNGNHMLALSGSVDTVSGSLERLLDLYQQLASQKAADSFGDNLENYKTRASLYRSDVEKANSNVERLAFLKEQLNTSNPGALGDVLNQGMLFAITEAERTTFEEAASTQDYEWIKEFFDTKILFYEQQAELYEQRLAGVFLGLNASIPALIQADPIYNQLDEEMQTVALKMASGLDLETIFGDLSEVEESDIIAYLGQFLLGIKNTNIDGLVEQYLSDTLSFDTILAILSRDVGKLSNDIKTDVTNSFKAQGYAVETFDDVLKILLQDMIDYKEVAQESAGDGVDTSGPSVGLANLRAALGETKTELEEVQEIISKFNAEGFDSLTPEEFETLANTLPGVRTELQSVASAAKDGKVPLEQQKQLIDSLTVSAKKLQSAKLADALSNVAAAAKDYGRDSSQVQEAMNDLAEVCPEVADAVWNEAEAMYDLSGAASDSASDINSFILATASANFASLNSQLATLTAQFYETGAAALWAAAAANWGPYAGKTQGQIGPDHEANLEEWKAEQTEDFIGMFNTALSSVKIPTGGGGSTKTEVEKLKEAYDSLSASLEHQISLQEQYFQDGSEALDSDVMREALIRQVGYYREIQRSAESALEAVKNYYRGKGMSDNEIEQQSEVQDLSKAWLEASQDVSDAMERMTKDIAAAFSASVDEMQGVYDTLHSAADEYAETGYITVDTLQAIIAHGVEYMALLQDENGQLVINEQKIKDIIAARTEQMAIESALAYIEALRTAKIMDNTAEMERLLFATQQATDASWGFVYANLALLGLEGDHYNAALKNINALRALAESASESIGNSGKNIGESLKDMQRGLNDILDYVMDMIKDETDAQIEAIEDQKDAFSEYIEMRKEALETAREETDYEEQKAELLKQIADLQVNIDALDLVGTREAEAQKAALLEEQHELQKELADLQGEYAYDQQVDTLDKMDEAYADSKDEEIKKLEDTISSEQKLYDLAISRIESQWNTLYDQLIEWNVRQGSSLNSEITESWNQALAAAQKYGSFVSAMDNIQADIDAIGTGGNINLGNTKYDDSYTDQDAIKAIVNKMKANSYNWFAYSQQGREDAAAENKQLGAQLAQYGVNAMIGDDGVWYIDRIGGQRLYDVYHTGGIVGGGSIKQNEQLALLENDEVVLTEKKFNKLGEHFKILGRLGDMMATFATSLSSSLSSGFSRLTDITSNVSNVANDNRDNRKVEITFGDTYITGANEATIKRHQEINKGFMDELARQLGVKW